MKKIHFKTINSTNTYLKENYKDNIELGYKFCENDISFRFEENNNIHDGWNLSINIYMTNKKNTFLSFIGKETVLPEVPDIEDEEDDKEVENAICEYINDTRCRRPTDKFSIRIEISNN